MPEAPGMFSTTIAWPSVRDTPSATRRAITSVAAPGPVGTISLTGRLGQVWAPAVVASATKAQHSSAPERIVTALHLISWGLFSFDPGRADDLRPFLRVVDDELAEIGGRAREDLRAQIGEPGLVFGIGEPGIDRSVELVDHVRGRALRRADALPADAFVAGHELADGREVRQQLRPGRARHRQCPHRTRLDLLSPG